jgi:hypothetical protein
VILDTPAWIFYATGTALYLGVPLVTRDARILDQAGALGLEILEM